MNLEEKIYLDLLPRKKEHFNNDGGFPKNKADETKIISQEKPKKNIWLLDKSISDIKDITKLLSNIAEIANLLVFKTSKKVIEENKAEKGFLDKVAEIKELTVQSSSSISSICFEIENLQQNINETALVLKEIGNVLRNRSRSIHSINNGFSSSQPVFY